MITEPRTVPSPDEVIERFRRKGPEPGMVWPDYDGFATCNVSQLILRNFGLQNRCPECLAPLLDRRYKRIVLLILDALGWNQLHSWADRLPSLQRICRRGQLVPLTTTFPSTTTVALTAIYTGLTPAEHTITGHFMYLHEVGSIVDVLRFSPSGDPRREVYAERGVDVHELFPMYTVFEPMREAGLMGVSITRGIFTNTALGWLHHVGADVTGYLHNADMFVHLRDRLRGRPREGLIVGYWDVVDMLSHEYGPFSEVVETAVDQFFYSLERLILDGMTPQERSETLLLMTADHGQTDVLPHEAICLSEEPRLRELLMLPPVGQGRAPYLYANQGQAEALGEALNEFESLRVCPSREALASGLFGPAEHADRIRRRVGDYVAITRGHTQVHGPEVSRDHLKPRGHHGSLGEDEMIVPLVVLPLDAW